MSNLIKSALVGAIIAFLWSMISWGILPWHMKTIHRFVDDEMVGETVKQNAPRDGIYVIPPTHCKAVEGGSGAIGPQIFLSICRNPASMKSVGPYICGFITQFIGALLISWLLIQTKMKYWSNVIFITVVALTAGVLVDLPAWNWMRFSFAYTIVNIIDLVITWFLAGLAMAKLIHHK